MMSWGRGRHRILKVEFQIQAYFNSFRNIDNFLSKCLQWSQWLLPGLSSVGHCAGIDKSAEG